MFALDWSGCIADDLLKAYDIHGVWPVPDQFDAPPPYPGRSRHHSEHSRHRYQHNPFFTFSNFDNFPRMPSNSFNRHRHRDAFTDPFVLFDSIFGDFEQQFFDEFQRPHQRSNARFRHHDPFGPGFPFGSSGMGGMLRGMGMSSNMGFPSMDLGPGSGGGRPRWRQESRTTTTVNGVTHSKWTRVDSDVSCLFVHLLLANLIFIYDV